MSLLLRCCCFAVAFWMTGCGVSPTRNLALTSDAARPQLTGRAMGGQQPVAGAAVQLYAVGGSGIASAAMPLLSSAAMTDTSGAFSITNAYTCPSASTLVYLVATGGNSGATSANAQIALMTALGACGSLSATTFVTINEVTTVASVAALFQYMASATAVGSDAANLSSLTAAFANVNEYANTASGVAPGPSLLSGFYASSTEINTLANILGACVNTSGGIAGDHSICGNLLSDATPAGGTSPTDTIGATLNLLNNPTLNLSALFALASGQAIFNPALTSAPSAWTFPILAIPNPPVFSLAAGSYSGTQTVTLSDTSSGSAIYYTLGGVASPTTASTLYTVPITVSASETVNAIAVAGGRAYSAVSTAAYAITPDFAVSASPQSVSLTGGTSQIVNLVATSSSGFTNNIAASFSGLPSGVTASPATLTLVPGVATEVTLTATASVASAITAATVNGISNGVTHTAPLVISMGAVADYSLAASAPGVDLVAGSSQSFTVTATAVNGFTGTVVAQIAGLPFGVTATPTSATLALGNSQTFTLMAGTNVSLGDTLLTVMSSAGTISHTTPVVLNVGQQSQDFLLAAPVAVSVSPGGSTTMSVVAGAIGGFTNAVNVSIGGLPSGVSASPSSFTLHLSPGGTASQTVTLTGTSGVTNGSGSFTVSGSSGSLSHQDSVLLTTAPDTTVAATVNTASPGSALPAFFVGFSMPSSNLEQFTGTGSKTSTSFLNLLSNLKPLVGSPNIRTTLETSSTTVTELQHLTADAAITVAGVTTSPQYILTTSSAYTLSSDATYAQQIVNAVGSGNVLGFELDNEPDQYVANGYRAPGWTFADYLTESASYASAFSFENHQLIATAAAGRGWDTGNPALLQQFGSQMATYTAHDYALSACSGTPTIASLLQDSSAHGYYSRYAPLVQTFGTVPVRAGEMNSVAYSGTAGVSNAFAASLWFVDTAFEIASAGAVGFNLHSGGTSSADPYDMAWNNSGNMHVYAPFYGVLFFAQAIQNAAKPLPVVMTKTSGNVKIWAMLDAANVVRVVILEKDTDGLSTSHTVSLNLGTAYKTGTVVTMSAPAVTSTSGITLGGQTFDGTTNGLPTGTANSSSVTPSGGVYTVTIQDGSAVLVTIPL